MVELPFTTSMMDGSSGGLLEGEATSGGTSVFLYARTSPQALPVNSTSSFPDRSSSTPSLYTSTSRTGCRLRKRMRTSASTRWPSCTTTAASSARCSGERYESHYARYGKLMGITLGDGALVNGFFDQGVDLRSSRPG